ncbi:hypothetical protein C9439_03825 [archaeon SCG-AAA382B04]|nr:hypothetical protein C9439_03825 [archaeon SCG-AAA382B04]
MKIDIISTYPPAKCGVANYISKLVDRFDDLGLDTKLIDQRFWSKSSPKFLIKVIKKVRSDDPDIVHLQYEYMLYGKSIFSVQPLTLPLLLELQGYPTIVTMHLVFPKDSEDTTLLKRSARNLATRLLSKSSAVIVHNEESRKIMESDYRIKETEVISHGTEKAKEPYDVGERNKILFFGFLSNGKGVEYLIEAMNKVKRKFNVDLEVVGSPHPEDEQGESYLKYLKKKVRDLRLEDCISFTGFLEEPKLNEKIKKAKICVFPYTREGEGIHECGPLNKVAGYGKPVITTENILKSEKVALEVPPKDSDSLNDAICKLLSNKDLRKKLGFKSWEFATSWKSAAKKHKKLYKRVATKKK